MAVGAVVIGGGLAGLAAAVSLARHGVQVLLLESKKFLGGRVYSIRDRDTGDWIDNGQHALMGCYHQTFGLLRELETLEGVSFQPRIEVPYRGADGMRDVLRGYPLPGPFHLLGGLLSMRSLSWKDKLSALYFGARMKMNRFAREGETIFQLCNRLGQSPAICKRMWDPIALSALNEDVDRADAALFRTVLSQAFFSSAADSRMALAAVPLQKLHGERAVEYLEQRGGSVRLESRVERLETHGRQIEAVILSSGERIACGACVAAVPAPVLAKLIRNSGLEERLPIPVLGQSPILSVYLWYDRPLSNEPFCCLQDCAYEWIFHRTNFMQPGEHRSYCVCLIVSAARRYQGLRRDDLIEMAIGDIRRVYPECGNPLPSHAAIFWEPRATFSATPENARKRLATQTDFENLFLAGDWTDTGFPATIEGAVVSGNRAADFVLQLYGGKKISWHLSGCQE